MFYADKVGLKTIADRLDAHAERSGDETLRAVPMLRRLADGGQGFATPAKAAAE